MGTNRECVESWVDRVFKAGTNSDNLTANIDQLISYATPIARWNVDSVILYNPRCNVTTTRHCSLVRTVCREKGIPVIDAYEPKDLQ